MGSINSFAKTLPWYAIEHGHAEVCDGEVHQKVVGYAPHPSVGQHCPQHQSVPENGGDEDDRECCGPDNVFHAPWVQNGEHAPIHCIQLV